MKTCFLVCLDDLLLKDTGASIRIYYLAKTLGELGHEVQIIIPTAKKIVQWANNVTVHGINGVIPQPILKVLSKLLGVSKMNALFFYDLLFILRLRHIISGSNIIQVEGASSSALLTFFIKKIFNKPIVVDSHDVFQALRIKHLNTLRKFIETFLETVAYRQASLILVVSEKEKQVLMKSRICSKKIVVIANGVDTKTFSPLLKSAKSRTNNSARRSYSVVFVGNMEYLPNQEAANLIVSKIAPKVTAKIRDVNFLIIGRTPPKLLTNMPHVTFTGTVKTIADFLATSDIAIAPLLQGSGTRLKILEYLSCGLPVVSTSIGAEGLDVEDGINILIEDDMDKFADKIIDLLMDKKLRRKLGMAARKLVVKKYDWQSIGKRLDEVYQLVIHNEEIRNRINDENICS
jgi:glycosyltransferase involved in cell wall biosynthesis